MFPNTSNGEWRAVIYKYTCPLRDVIEFWLPKNSRLLNIDMMGTSFCLWAEVLIDKYNTPIFDNEHVHCRVYGTGRPLTNGVEPNIIQYYKTVIQNERLVWHLYVTPEIHHRLTRGKE